MVLKRNLLMMLFSLALAFPCPVKGEDPKIMSEVKTLLEQHNKAFNAHDLKGVMTLYSSDPNSVLMGTGPNESYVGDEAIGGAYNQFFSKFDADTLSFKYDWIAAVSKGNFAWFAVTTTVEGVAGNEKGERVFNMSGALLKEGSKWRIAGMHFSRLGAEEQQAGEQPK
jgi:ketosteroid isomerase-like protein